jgi:hypothetical protein
VAGQQQEFLPQPVLIQRALRRALEVGDGAPEHAAVPQGDGHDRCQRRRTVLGGGSLELVAALSVVNVALVAVGLALALRLGVRF